MVGPSENMNISSEYMYVCAIACSVDETDHDGHCPTQYLPSAYPGQEDSAPTRIMGGLPSPRFWERVCRM